MRASLTTLALGLFLGSCSFLNLDDYQVEQWNARFSAPLSYTGDLDIEGPGGSVNTDFDEQAYGFAIEAENAAGFAPYIEYSRGELTFDWPTDLKFSKFTGGARFYSDTLGNTDSWLARTRAYGSGSLSILQPDTFLDGAERHHMTSGYMFTIGTGLQRDFGEDYFMEVGGQFVYGIMDEAVNNLFSGVSVTNDWEWTDLQLLFGIGRHF
jgi:hypothetical protein